MFDRIRNQTIKVLAMEHDIENVFNQMQVF